MGKKNSDSRPAISEQARQAIRHGEAHFQIRAHPHRVLSWIAGPDGAWEHASGDWSALTGRPTEAELGWAWLEHVHADDRGAVEAAYRHGVANGQPMRCQYRLAGAGHRVQVLCEGQPRLDGGECCGWIGFSLWMAAAADAPDANGRIEPAVRQLLGSLELPGLVLGLGGEVAFCNEALAGALGLPAEKVVGRSWQQDFLAPDSAGAFAADIANRSHWGDFPPKSEVTVLDVMGGRHVFALRNTVLRDGHGRARAIASIGQELSDERQARLPAALTAKVFESSVDAMLITDRNNDIIAVNDAFCRLTGYSRDEAIGRNPRLLKSGRHDAQFYREMWRAILEQGHWRGEVWDRRKDGSLYPKSLAIGTIRDQAGEITNFSATFFDVSERKRAEERLEFLAHYDPLTRLPNRALLQDRLEVALARARRSQRRIALMFIDLDRFKEINDRYGHAFGDEVLKAVAQRLKAGLREADTVARLGGDEFIVVVPDLDAPEPAADVAAKLLESLARPYVVGNETVSTVPSIGVSIYPDDHNDIGMLMQGADDAMYAAKRQRRSGIAFWRELPGGGSD